MTPDWLSFQIWDTLQSLCSTVRGMLTSHAIYKGVGVGRQVGTHRLLEFNIPFYWLYLASLGLVSALLLWSFVY